MRVCQPARSLSEAGRARCSPPRAPAAASTNDADRLRKYLARFESDLRGPCGTPPVSRDKSPPPAAGLRDSASRAFRVGPTIAGVRVPAGNNHAAHRHHHRPPGHRPRLPAAQAPGAACRRSSCRFGTAHVFYPEATEERCTAALLLDVDPVGLVRDRGGQRARAALEQYVNDRPYVASSFLSVAIAQVFGTALAGSCKERPELAATPIPLRGAARRRCPCRGGEALLRRLFEPLGYAVAADAPPARRAVPRVGREPVLHASTLRAHAARCTSCSTHLYVLHPGARRRQALLGRRRRGREAAAPRRGLAGRAPGARADRPPLPASTGSSLAREALARLRRGRRGRPGRAAEERARERGGASSSTISLNEQRLGAVRRGAAGERARSACSTSAAARASCCARCCDDRQFDRDRRRRRVAPRAGASPPSGCASTGCRRAQRERIDAAPRAR